MAEIFSLKPGQRLSDLYEVWREVVEGRVIAEAAATPQFPVLLKDGLRALLFSEFAGIATEWQNLVQTVPSNKQFETWLRTQGMGTLPKVDEQGTYQQLNAPDLKPETVIQNFKRGGILSVTEEMIRFDKYGVIQSNVRDLAGAAAQTREEAVFTALCTAASYVATTSDNKIGNNTSTNGLSPANIITAYNTLTTMFDRSSGRPLGIIPDTLVTTPDNAFFANQLLMSPTLGRTGAATFDANVAADIYGQGVRNPFFGLVKRIIISYWLRDKGTQYAWILCQAKKGVVLQEVEGLQLLDLRAEAANESYFTQDMYRYRVRDWFGVGIVDDRYLYYANSTTAPAVG